MVRRNLLLILNVLLLSACASGKVDKLSPIIDLPGDLPKELQDKFKVEETPSVPAAGTAPADSGPGGAVVAPEKEPKKGKKIKPAQAARGAFTYPMRRLEKDPVVVGEKLVYDVTYFGVSAGNLTMEVMPHAQMNQRKVYQIRGRARTSKFFEMFYRIDDTVETFMDYDGLFSHRFHIVLDESKQTRDSLELYDSEKGQAYYWSRWNHYRKGYTETKEFKPISRFPQDSISVLYYMRSLPLAIGKKFKIPVVTEGNEWEAEIEVLRTEMEDTPMGTVRCLVMRPETRFQGVLKKTGDSLFWVTDDDRRILVRVEAKVKIGAVVLKLKEASLGPK